MRFIRKFCVASIPASLTLDVEGNKFCVARIPASLILHVEDGEQASWSSKFCNAFIKRLDDSLASQCLNCLPPDEHILVTLTHPQSFIIITQKYPYAPYQ